MANRRLDRKDLDMAPPSHSAAQKTQLNEQLINTNMVRLTNSIKILIYRCSRLRIKEVKSQVEKAEKKTQ